MRALAPIQICHSKFAADYVLSWASQRWYMICKAAIDCLIRRQRREAKWTWNEHHASTHCAYNTLLNPTFFCAMEFNWSIMFHWWYHFRGVIAILLGCLTFFQWLRPEDEPDSHQEIDPWREWNRGLQLGMSVCACVCFTAKIYWLWLCVTFMKELVFFSQHVCF